MVYRVGLVPTADASRLASILFMVGKILADEAESRDRNRAISVHAGQVAPVINVTLSGATPPGFNQIFEVAPELVELVDNEQTPSE